ncbi:MAG: glycoside hydrolase family 15 protein [Patescibacteria group bacterium]|nr:glycoside hydrolase family 15 protein [Patescibacteria group bacterium]
MRLISLANGQMLVMMDSRAQVRDLYFPYVGLENHMGGHLVHRIGVHTDQGHRWFDDPSWDIQIASPSDTLASSIVAINNELKVRIDFTDVVYNEKTIFLRKLVVTNLDSSERTIKVFFCHEFQIYESYRGDTAYYDPIHKCIVHYKGRRVFLINALTGESGFDQYSTGKFGSEGMEGTYRDAEDGVLQGNAIQHGKVDSVIGVTLHLNYKEEQTIYYWIAAATSIKGALDLNDAIQKKTPEHILQSTEDYWHAWLSQHDTNFCGIDDSIRVLYNKSLLLVRSHVDNNGSILASGDSDMLYYGFDSYSYMWPRDGALTALTLLRCGYLNNARRFFEFCFDVITEDGYLMHKYRPDGSLGSSWHPWTRNGKITLPIQEDETALVLRSLWYYYQASKDLEFIEANYADFIERAAKFLVTYTDEKTGLPLPSYDLWEEKYGTHTFTAASVYAALVCVAQFAEVLGKTESQVKFSHSAEKIKQAILKYLYTTEDGFVKMVNFRDEKVIYDRTLDSSSLYGIVKFGVLPYSDERVVHSMKLVEDRLLCRSEVGGICRYEGDQYFRQTDEVPGTPWFICSLWLAQYQIEAATKPEDLEKPLQWLRWCVKYALPSGALSEQIHPLTGAPLSATPLTWSHAEFINTVNEYIAKMRKLGMCPVREQ